MQIRHLRMVHRKALPSFLVLFWWWCCLRRCCTREMPSKFGVEAACVAISCANNLVRRHRLAVPFPCVMASKSSSGRNGQKADRSAGQLWWGACSSRSRSRRRGATVDHRLHALRTRDSNALTTPSPMTSRSCRMTCQ
ncbi:hypothetical protein B0T19DRAFT_201089 [Cercophora scortea]|uniref:Secreted protein n=1 Tax=Cercophora scortea TaxID=314031 RepID=A0AAE0M8D8_9PEZI|nr:hypothetical protein B0T19DRAFT_201089 [Cercophora scortea]